jgi:hypothetical protein
VQLGLCGRFRPDRRQPGLLGGLAASFRLGLGDLLGRLLSGALGAGGSFCLPLFLFLLRPLGLFFGFSGCLSVPGLFLAFSGRLLLPGPSPSIPVGEIEQDQPGQEAGGQ